MIDQSCHICCFPHLFPAGEASSSSASSPLPFRRAMAKRLADTPAQWRRLRERERECGDASPLEPEMQLEFKASTPAEEDDSDLPASTTGSKDTNTHQRPELGDTAGSAPSSMHERPSLNDGEGERPSLDDMLSLSERLSMRVSEWERARARQKLRATARASELHTSAREGQSRSRVSSRSRTLQPAGRKPVVRRSTAKRAIRRNSEPPASERRNYHDAVVWCTWASF